MNRLLKYILFRTVLIIIALHAVISHPHSDELTEEKHFEIHQKSNSLIGIIRLAFHENSHENLDNLVFVQCENVKKLDYKSKYPRISSLNSSLSATEKRVAKKIVNSPINNFNRSLFIKLNGLRGPPSLI